MIFHVNGKYSLISIFISWSYNGPINKAQFHVRLRLCFFYTGNGIIRIIRHIKGVNLCLLSKHL